MYNSKRKRTGTAAQGAASQEVRDKSAKSSTTGKHSVRDEHEYKVMLQKSKDFLAQYEGGTKAHPEIIDSADYWYALYFVTADELNQRLCELVDVRKKYNRMGKMWEDARCELAYERERVRLLRIGCGENPFDDLDELDL